MHMRNIHVHVTSGPSAAAPLYTTMEDPRTRRQRDDAQSRSAQTTAGGPEQTRPAVHGRARRGREQDFAEINRRMYEEIRSSRDPRDNMEDG